MNELNVDYFKVPLAYCNEGASTKNLRHAFSGFWLLRVWGGFE